MLRRLAFASIGLALTACSGGGSDVDQRFAEFCETDTMFKGSEPCTNPSEFSDAQKERIMDGMVELEQGMQEMEESLDAAVEEARRSVEEAGN